MLRNHASPIRLSSRAAARLPRWALLAVFAAFALSILFSHDLWTGHDAVALGLAESIARSGGWLLPTIGGELYTENAPLFAWPAAALAILFSSKADTVILVRLAGMFWFALGIASIWYGVWHLARRPEAQPVAFAFGGEASPREYSRTVADCAALLTVSCFGLIVRLHGCSWSLALFAASAFFFCALVWSLEHPVAGSLAGGASAVLAALVSQPRPALALLAAALIVILFVREAAGARLLRLALVAAGAAAAAALYAAALRSQAPGQVQEFLTGWLLGFAGSISPFRLETGQWFSKNLVWFLWPAWPAALWALWSWRRQLSNTHILVPSAMLASWVALWCISAPDNLDSLVFAAVPAIAALAAFGLLAFRSSLESILDWFSVSVFTIAAAGLWTYYFAWCAGQPWRLAHTIDRLVPGLTPGTGTFALATAAAATAVWLAMAGRRLAVRPTAAWRGAWFSAMGLLLIWVLASTLFVRVIDANRSYSDVAAEIRSLVRSQPGPHTIGAIDVSASVKAMLLHFGSPDLSGSAHSPILLVRCRSSIGPAPTGYRPLGRPIQRVKTDERFQLYTAIETTK